MILINFLDGIYQVTKFFGTRDKFSTILCQFSKNKAMNLESLSEEEVKHCEKLKNFCRLCGQWISFRGRKPKEIFTFSSILKHININIESDNPKIHPTIVCEKCRKICVKIESKLKLECVTYRPQIEIFQFEPHTSQDDCYICNKTGSSGGRKSTNFVNQHNAAENHVVNMSICSGVSSNPVKLDSLDFEVVKEYASSYVFIETDNVKSFMIFCKVNKPHIQLRTLIEVTIFDDRTWKVSVIGKDTSTNAIFSTFPEKLSTDSCCSLLHLCSSLDLCIGNNDFGELCEMRRDNNEYAKFHDTKDNVIASEVNDLICESLSLRSTIRHYECKLINANDGKENFRCQTCTAYRPTLIALKHKKKNKPPLTINPSSSIPNKFLSNKQLCQKVDLVQTERKKLIVENKKLVKKIEKLVEQNGVNLNQNDNDELSDVVREGLINNAKTQTFPAGSAIQLLFEQQLKHSQLKSAKQMRWHPIMIRWALGLYHTSPAAYDFLKRSSFLKLPSRSTLLDYSIYTTPQSGFNVDVIERLYDEADVENLSPHERNVALLYDELKIKSDLVYNKATGQIVGFVELGELNEEISQFERQFNDDVSNDRPVATHILAFMVRGIYSKLNFVFAYFPCTGASCDELFPCVWDAVTVLESIGFIVRCFVSDGASPNRCFYKLHKPTKGIPYFAVNLCSTDRKIYFICDPPHLMKTTRNNWENSEWNKKTRKLFYEKQVISWRHLVQLWEFDSNMNAPGLYMTKIRHEHVYLTPSSRMNVRLAAQSLSSRVADALKFEGKADTKSTEKFVRMFNNFFDCLNVQYKNQAVHTKNDSLNVYVSVNDPRFEWLEKTFLKDFIDDWETTAMSTAGLTPKEQRKLCLSQQTIEGLRITVKSFVAMVKELLGCYPGMYVLSGKFNQDALEQHFSAQRRKGGNNTNPTVYQYGYNEISLHTIKSKNVASLKGNSRIHGDKQIDMMKENGIPMKRRKKLKEQCL